MIKQKDYSNVIAELNLGTSTAENDPLLESAQIKTQEFYDLYIHDRIDVIRGMKGVGKTALYRVFYYLKEELAKDKKLYCIFGVEAKGDSVFLQFKNKFSKFTAVDFENFWLIYFMTLIKGRMSEDEFFYSAISDPDDRAKLESVWAELKISNLVEKQTLFQIISQTIDRVKALTLGLELKTDQTTLISAVPNVRAEFNGKERTENAPKYIGDIRDTICGILRKHGIRIWVMLDRLDEVFLRRSQEEDNGLKGLLKAAYNLSQPELRVKLFLRDDIVQQLAGPGFTAMTHVFDRSAPAMVWAGENILLLVTSRVFSNPILASYFGVDMEKIKSSPEYRRESFYKIFPATIGKIPTFDWVMNVLADGHGFVTPRDAIDFFNFTKSIEFKDFQLRPGDREFLVSAASFPGAVEQLSKDKREKFLAAEFPHMNENIVKLEGGHSIHNSTSLERLYGLEWNKTAADFLAIGLFEHDSKKAIYRIPKLWMKGLRVTQGKCF